MGPSTASTKFLCVTLALLALSTSSSMASALHEMPSSFDDSICDSCSSVGEASFDSATIVNRVPIHLPSLTSTSALGEEHDTATQRNASVYDSDDASFIEDDEFELPAKLAALIANAKSKYPAASETAAPSSEIRYYATYGAEKDSCSAKSSSSFERWEESFASLEDCCEVAFGWDYDSCMRL